MVTYWNRRFAYDILICALIIIIPFLLSLHLLFDDTNGESVIHFLGIEFQHPMAHNRIFMWAVLVRLIPILLLGIWYLSSQDWWKYFILLSIIPFSSSFALAFYIGPNWFYYHFLSFIAWTGMLILLNRFLHNTFQNKDTTLTTLFYFPIISDKNFKTIFKRITLNREIQSGEEDKFNNYVTKNLFLVKSLIDRNYIISSKFKVLNRKSLRVTLVVLSFIPIIYFSYLIIPKSYQNIDLYFFKIGNFGFSNVKSFLFYFYLKLCVLIPLCIWFITCHYWWRYAILCPIILYAYQLWEAVQTGVVWVDETEYVKAAPYIVILIGLLLFVAEKIKYQSKIIESYNEINRDIEDILVESIQNNSDFLKKRARFTILSKKDVHEDDVEKHLSELKDLKEELLKDLRNSSVGYSKK